MAAGFRSTQMRKALIGILLAAGATAPAFAQDEEARTTRPDRAAQRYERIEQRNQQRHEQREQRQETRQEQRQPVAAAAPAQSQRLERREDRIETRQERIDTRQAQGGGERRQDRLERREDRLERREDRVDTRQEQVGNRNNGGWRNQQGSSGPWIGNPNDPDMERHRRRYERVEQQNQRNWQRDQGNDRRDWRNDRRADRRWDRSWRNDTRYDWSNYRSRYRDHYRLGRYYDPFGSGYRRFSIGIQIGQPFYSQRYWISDPWQYRLPQAGPGYQWVRYYNDVLLIDTWSGEVVDVIYDFFW